MVLLKVATGAQIIQISTKIVIYCRDTRLAK
jgi:hypothetical protein